MHASNSFGKDFFQMMKNDTFGKTMEKNKRQIS